MHRDELTIRVLEEPEAAPDGVAHRAADRTALVRWSEIRLAVAAEIGEPEGVRTIVFDLVTASDGAWRVHRLDADPGEDAIALARAIEGGIASEVPTVSIKSLATDGIPSRWYPDLASFEEETRSLLAPYADALER